MAVQKKFFSTLFFFIFSFAFASYDFNDNCKTAYNEIIKLDFITARKIIASEKKNNDANLIPYYLDNYIDFLTLVIGEDKNAFATLKSNKDRRLSILEKGDRKSPYYRYCIAELHLQWAASRIKFNEYVTAAYEINKAYRLLKRNNEEFPAFIPNYKSLGLLNSIIGSIPDNFKWITRIIGMDATIEEGINQLGIALVNSENSEEYAYLQAETLFFLSYVNLNLSNDVEQLKLLIDYIDNSWVVKQLTKKSALINYAVANIFIRSKIDNDRAIGILESYQHCQQCFPFWYRDLVLGMAKLKRQDDNADLYMKIFIEKYKGQNYIKEAYQKLGWHHFLKHDTTAYLFYMQKVLEFGSAETDEDKQALIEAQSGVLPNYYLLKSRLLFDGGYYSKALSTLTSIHAVEVFNTTDEALDFTYRMGRIYHEMKNFDKAISFYEITIDKGAHLTSFYAANACLQLGLIYEKINNKEKARYFFIKAQNLKNTEYKNSIDQKAKAGINRLK